MISILWPPGWQALCMLVTVHYVLTAVTPLAGSPATLSPHMLLPIRKDTQVSAIPQKSRARLVPTSCLPITLHPPSTGSTGAGSKAGVSNRNRNKWILLQLSPQLTQMLQPLGFLCEEERSGLVTDPSLTSFSSPQPTEVLQDELFLDSFNPGVHQGPPCTLGQSACARMPNQDNEWDLKSSLLSAQARGFVSLEQEGPFSSCHENTGRASSSSGHIHRLLRALPTPSLELQWLSEDTVYKGEE